MLLLLAGCIDATSQTPSSTFSAADARTGGTTGFVTSDSSSGPSGQALDGYLITVDGFGRDANSPGLGDGGACMPSEDIDGACRSVGAECDDVPTVQLKAVTRAALAELNSDCLSDARLQSPACRSAIHEFCRQDSCATSGFGPVEVHALGLSVVCLKETVILSLDLSGEQGVSDGGVPKSESADAGKAQGITEALEVLATQCSSADQINRLGCQVSIHNYCSVLGYASGVGPMAMPDSEIRIVCFRAAASESFIELVRTIAMSVQCDFGQRVEGEDAEGCSQGIHDACRQEARGFLTGFGPISANGGVLASGGAATFGFVCLGRLAP